MERSKCSQITLAGQERDGKRKSTEVRSCCCHLCSSFSSLAKRRFDHRMRNAQHCQHQPAWERRGTSHSLTQAEASEVCSAASDLTVTFWSHFLPTLWYFNSSFNTEKLCLISNICCYMQASLLLTQSSGNLSRKLVFGSQSGMPKCGHHLCTCL